MTEDNFPVPAKACRWINPRTDQQTKFPLQHAVDFAHFVDGGSQLVPANVGEYFFQPPAPQAPVVRPTNVQRTSLAKVQELFDPFLDDDESPQEPAVTDSRFNRQEVPTGGSAKRSRERLNDVPTEPKRFRAVLDQDMLIIEKLRGTPVLLERFQNIRQGAASDVNTGDDED
ncbi:hypothetical protein F441_03080 [Phytophthora nicotianae CJ01A1]|uniref:Uncharacterized protein n=2 Tax=Phytophthora nicotianae TaxID=4792 RepID=W2JLL6_PHYNI|nr:hypothetical protein L915_02973 [Phytophthora nicotianae]ETL47294.1 hypothetical protein L916_02949 [Phytophthora nicotianae]ETM53600.1 hypothetical protein L914_02939 [Phytophthora nicotianae]ETP23846.1 hypothetical protein F441_03080 [Phytophthora nicotianae CJ01A1]